MERRAVTVRPLDLSPDGIAEMVSDSLVAAGGGWSMGVQGALAEFVPSGGVKMERDGRRVEALTAGGGLRLVIPDTVRAFLAAEPHRPDEPGTVYLTVPRASLAAPAAGVTARRPDRAALRPEDGDGVLFDLAAGHAVAAFCVRTRDPALAARLRAVEGATWREALEAVGVAIVAASPHRVVITPLGRIEVWSPIPSDGASSPDGPHTHLLPGLLATGRELPDGHALPADVAPAAAFHPPPGRRLPDR